MPPTAAIAIAVAALLPGAPLSELRSSPARRPWCDMAARVARMLPVATAEDRVFQRPTPSNKARVGLVRKALLQREGPLSLAAAEVLAKRWGPVFSGPQGPALARLALSDASLKVRIPAILAARRIAAEHPRLAGFVGGDVRNPEPAAAIAAGLFLLDTGCDTSASYALDALGHAAPEVRLAVALYALRRSRRMADMGLVRRVLHHVAVAEPSPRVRAAIAREAGRMGWLGAGGVLRGLTRDADELVRAEATVALARVTGTVRPAAVRTLARSRSPWSRISACRAAAVGLTDRPRLATGLLRPLLRDRRRARDPLGPAVGGRRWRILETARLASDYLSRR